MMKFVFNEKSRKWKIIKNVRDWVRSFDSSSKDEKGRSALSLAEFCSRATIEEEFNVSAAAPVAVAGDPLNRHGIILAKNMLAKKLGVKTGEAIWQAKLKAPDLVTVPPDFRKYLKFSRLARQILYDYTDQIEPFGIDENWIDVTGSTILCGDGAAIANSIRQRIKEELGLTVSIGVSFNKIFAKLGSDMKKPDAVTVIPHDKFKDIIWRLPVSELLYVGKATQRKLTSRGIMTIGDLANYPRAIG